MANKLTTLGYTLKRFRDSGYMANKLFAEYHEGDPRAWTIMIDPGFRTDNMVTLLYVSEPLFIEINARVAQIYFHECVSAEMYDGQWQGDKQRSSLYLSSMLSKVPTFFFCSSVNLL